MPSPFPGMDPFLEFQLWDEFHSALIYDVADTLVPQVRPNYVVRRERRVYVETDPDDPDRYLIPDATVAKAAKEDVTTEMNESGGVTAPSVVEVTLPMPVTHREAFLTVRERESLEVVTVIELLSPSNKRVGSKGRTEYLEKRDALLESPVNLVEIDLLRGGARLPTVEPLPTCDYYTLVSRGHRRPRAEVYPWMLREPLPTIPIPLSGDVADAELDLQQLFQSRFDRSGYDYSLNYDITPNPEFRQDDLEWIQKLLA